MKIKIDGKPYKIKKLSELSFTEFNNIMIKGQCNDLKSYLSLFIDMPMKEFLNAKLKGVSLTSLAERVFDCDEAAVIEDKRNTVKLRGDILIVGEAGLWSVGQSYLFELNLFNYKDGKINEYELAIWALAIALLKDDEISDMTKAQDNYNDLISQTWVSVLPQAFFFLKRTVKAKISSPRLSTRFMQGLRKTNFLTRISKRLLIEQEQNRQSSYFAKFLISLRTKYLTSI